MAENRRIAGLKKREIGVILKDLAILIDTNCELSDQAKYDIIYKMAWEWTEGRTTATKYYGCKYWSEKALKEKFPESKIACGETIEYDRKDEKDLRHEHVVPKKLFMEWVWYMLKNPNQFNSDGFKNVIENNLVACVVTKEEDSNLIKDKLPIELNSECAYVNDFECIKYPWARYKIAQDKGEMTTIYELEWCEGKKAIVKGIVDTSKEVELSKSLNAPK